MDWGSKDHIALALDSIVNVYEIKPRRWEKISTFVEASAVSAVKWSNAGEQFEKSYLNVIFLKKSVFFFLQKTIWPLAQLAVQRLSTSVTESRRHFLKLRNYGRNSVAARITSAT